MSVQKQAKCIIGEDYPKPIVDHGKVSKENIQKMKIAYANQSTGGISDDDEYKAPPKDMKKRRKR